MYNAAIIPCNNLARKYGKIDISVLEIIPHTCNNTENPPNPNKKAEIIIFVEIFLIGILETIFTPFVSSIIPEIIPFEKCCVEKLFQVDW